MYKLRVYRAFLNASETVLASSASKRPGKKLVEKYFQFLRRKKLGVYVGGGTTIHGSTPTGNKHLFFAKIDEEGRDRKRSQKLTLTS